ncbi:unnamed protein product [Mytilus edulis]|uniref:B box-type domain-containing protein n=1 Tax=Mytilus edulis TaxID=6550 RepID=A0A8S3S5I8_MYTED|nr:unnamed protein product [Mytilus edulis]
MILDLFNILDQILFKITDLEVQISTKRKADAIESELTEEPTKCYVRWTLSTPSSWSVEDIKRKLRSVTELTNFTIEFVYSGSLIIDTSVSLDLITVPDRFSIAFLEFLQSFVQSCEIDTTVSYSVDVTILASFEPYMGTEITEDFTFGPCRTCSNRNLTTEAEKWCKDCEELYCNTCSIYHSATTHLANHTILSLNKNMKHFPPNISQTITCNIHREDFNSICKTDQQILCTQCIHQVKEYCSERKAFMFMHNIVKSIMKAEKTFTTSLSDMKIVCLHCESDEQVYIQEVASCFNLNGGLLWQTNMSIGRQNIQIAVDNWGNCYIPSYKDDNIIVISNDGKQRKLFRHLDPTAVYFDKKKDRLIVITDTGLCKVFDVTLNN